MKVQVDSKYIPPPIPTGLVFTACPPRTACHPVTCHPSPITHHPSPRRPAAHTHCKPGPHQPISTPIPISTTHHHATTCRLSPVAHCPPTLTPTSAATAAAATITTTGSGALRPRAHRYVCFSL